MSLRRQGSPPSLREPLLLSVKEAARILGTSTATIRRLIWAGMLPVVRLTRRIQIDTRDLEHLVERMKDRSGW